MNVLIATGVYPPESGGPATYTTLLEKELPRRGVEIVVLPFRTVRGLPKVVRHAAYFFKVLRQARGVQAIYALDPVSVGLPAALAALLLGKKLLLRIAGDYAWEQSRQRFGVTDELDEFQTKRYGFRTQLLRRVQTFTSGRALRIVVPSEYMKRIVSHWADPQKIVVIYSSIELPVVYELPEHRPEGFLVVSAGRRVPWKGFEALERVVALEKRWSIHIAENVSRAQALGWIQAADVFVLNSTYEGLSHVLIEAMSLSKPIIATAVGGNPELVEDGVHGLLIPPKDDTALHEALKKIEQHPELAHALGNAAAVRAQDFSIQNTVGRLTELLSSL